MTVTIVNAFDDSNLGGAAITAATLDLARRLDAGPISLVPVNAAATFASSISDDGEVEVMAPPFRLDGAIVSTFIELVHSVVLLAAPRLPSSRPAVQRLRESAVCIAKGGYVYRERSGGWRDLLAGWFTMWPLRFAGRAGASTVAYSASIGPFSTRPSRWLSRFMLRGVDVICPRDDASLESWYGLARGRQRAQVVPMPDCVFGRAPTAKVVPTSGGDHNPSREALLVPRSVDQRSWQQFCGLTRDALQRSGVTRARVLVQAVEDHDAAARLAEELPEIDIVVEAAPDLATLEHRYQQAQFTVSARMHGVILSLVNGTPAIGIDVDRRKATPVLTTAGFEHAIVSPPSDAPGDARAASLPAGDETAVAWLLDRDARTQIAERLAVARDRVHEANQTILAVLRA